MYNILIVDDDNLIREDLKTMTDWQKYGFQIIGDVSNGAQALNFIQFSYVDIIITDICMPIMDGVELIKTVKSIKPQIKFIVISNYDDFKYVKDAMKYGASDYILKYEIEEDNLLHLLNTVKDEIERGSQAEMYKFEQLWRKILKEKNFNNKLYEESKKFKEFNNWKNFVIVIFKCNPAAQTDTIHQLLQSNCSESIVVQMNEKQWCIIMWHNNNSWMYIRASIDQTVRRIFSDLQKYSIHPFAVVSKMCTDISKISAVYSNALKCLHYNFYMGSGSVVYQDLQKDFSYELTPLKKLFDSLITGLISDRDPKVEKHLDLIFQHIQQKNYFPVLLYDLVCDFVMELYAKLNLSVTDVFGKDTIVSSEVRKCSTVTALKQWLRTYITETINAHRNQFQSAVQNTEITRKEVIKAIQYINHNYMNEITLDELASLTNLSRNYFCRIFKEETGEGFIDYLNKIRINKAKLLLSNTDQRIVDIAYNVGIKDYRYFCNIFKKFTGSCPSKFRDKQH